MIHDHTVFGVIFVHKESAMLSIDFPQKSQIIKLFTARRVLWYLTEVNFKSSNDILKFLKTHNTSNDVEKKDFNKKSVKTKTGSDPHSKFKWEAKSPG